MKSKITDIMDKPYDQCISCEHFGVHCDGPNFLAMDSVARMGDWCRKRKDYLHSLDDMWTNAYIAEKALLSKSTVDNFFRGDISDMRISTLSQIFQILTNGTWGQYPCALASFIDDSDTELLQRATTAETECKQLLAINREMSSHLSLLSEQLRLKDEQIAHKDKQIAHKDKQIAHKDEQMRDRAEYLRRKDRWIRFLAVSLFVCVATMIIFLIIDHYNPNKGFFWLE